MSAGFSGEDPEPLPMVRMGCPLCGEEISRPAYFGEDPEHPRSDAVLPRHDDPAYRSMCIASGFWLEDVLAMAQYRQEDPRFLDRAHP